MELLSYDFIQRGIVAGILIGVSSALMGVYLILKRLAFLGAGLSHAAFGGIALSFLLGTDPYLFTAIFTLVVANLVEFLTKGKKVPGDTAIAIIFSSGIALAVMVLGVVRGFGENLFSYLFGNILVVSKRELAYAFGVFLIVILYLALFYKKLIVLTFSEELAKVKGVNVKLMNYTLSSLTALVTVASIKAVGIILASSLVVIPAMTGLLLGSSFLGALVWSAMASLLSVVGGIVLAFYYDLPPSGAIVGISIALFLLAYLLRNLPLK